MNEKRQETSPVHGPARRRYVPDVVLLSKLLGLHAILLAILNVIAYLTERRPDSFFSWAVVLVLLTLVLSLRLVIRMTRMALLSALVAIYAIFLVILHVVAYLMGSQQDPSVSQIILLVALALLTLVLSLGLVIRRMRPWPQRLPDLGRRMALCLVTTVGLVALVVLPFTRFSWPPYKTSTWAFRRYVRANVDLDAMRAWLNTLDGKYDPNDAHELVYAPIEERWPEAAPWAKTITPLHPDCVRLAPDHNHHPVIRISGFRGHSLVVGSESMPAPPANLVKRDKYPLPLGPGAYVAHERSPW